MSVVDPPDLPLRPTLRRLLPLWWEQRRLAALAIVCALMVTAVSIGIPIIISHVIDDVVGGDNPTALLPYLLLILALALARFGVNFLRRYTTARIGIYVEARLRGMLYDAYLRYPARLLRPARDRRGDLAGDERRLPGPLLHRLGRHPGSPERADDRRRGDRARGRERPARADLGRGACRRSPSSPGTSRTGCSRSRASCRSGRATSRRPQTRPSSGSRWCRPSAARPTCARASTAAPRRSAHETMRQASVEANFLPGLLFLPTLGIAGVLFFGGRDVIAGTLTLGEFMLFMTLLLQLVWPLEALGWIINLGQRAVASAGRSFAWLERDRAAGRARGAAAAARPGHSASGSRTSASPTARAPRCCAASTWRWSRARSSPSAARPASGKTTLLNLLPRFYDPTAGRVLVGGVDDPRRRRSPSCGARSRS